MCILNYYVLKNLASTTDWLYTPVVGAIGNDLSINNSSGFTVLPCSFRVPDGTWGIVGAETGMWSTTEGALDDAFSFVLGYNDPEVYPQYYYKNAALSIRCLKD